MNVRSAGLNSRTAGQLLLLGCLTVCLNVTAQEKKHLSAFPADGFSFTGTWSCEGAMGNGRVHKSAFSGSSILDGKWLELAEQDVEPASGYVAEYLIGYDAQRGRLVEFDANNFGAATYTSGEGWTDRTLTMTSPAAADSRTSASADAKPSASAGAKASASAGAAPSVSADRFVYSITSADTFTVDWQVSRDGGLSWKPGDHLVCQRKAS